MTSDLMKLTVFFLQIRVVYSGNKKQGLVQSENQSIKGPQVFQADRWGGAAGRG
jgi:hypothetical protein